MNNTQSILVLDDEEGFRVEVSEFLEQEGYRVYRADRPSAALNLLDSIDIDVALLDIRLPEMDGITFLKKINQHFPLLGVIMMTGYGDMNSVIRAMRNGAVDFLNKPFKFSEVKEAIDRTIKFKTIHREDEWGRVVEGLLDDSKRIIGKSKSISGIREMIQKMAAVPDATVLITGESGTGKELVARAIHQLSQRKNEKFIPVNCSTIPEELFENEFFGHVKGSYTDARQDQKGLFEIADKGTLFLDEIGDMKLSMQTKLLRVIEEKKISRIGGYDEKPVDVRILTATNQNLENMVEEKRFRADLYHRLNLLRIDIPPLREHKDDIPLLFDFFLQSFIKKYNKPIKKVEESVILKLAQYDFPGNVRELKNYLERAVILCDEIVLKEMHFRGLECLIRKSPKFGMDHEPPMHLEELEKQSICRALKYAGSNKSKAACMLNISRQALDRKIKKYNITFIK